MLGWDDKPKEAPSIFNRKSVDKATPTSPGAQGPRGSGGGAHGDAVIFADGKKAGWWQASDNGIMNEAEAALDKGAAKKGFTPQFAVGGGNQYGSIFARTASGNEAPAAAAPAVSEAIAAATSAAVAQVTTQVNSMDPFAELVSPSGQPQAVAAAVAIVSPATAAADGAAPAVVHVVAVGSPGGNVGSPKDAAGIHFADGKKSGWWAASDNGILNEADAADDAKGAKKSFSSQLSVTGQKNNYASMLNWKQAEAETAAAPAAAAPTVAAPPEGGKDDDWDPFQSAPK